MADTSLRLFSNDAFSISSEEVNRQNRHAIRYYATAGVFAGVVNIIVQLAVRRSTMLAFQSSWMLLYFIAFFLVDRFVIPQKLTHSSPLVYLLEAPAILISILLGTVWDPTHQAFTFFAFIVVVPVFVLDRPLRVVGVTLGWNLLFILLCFVTKEHDLFVADLLHALEFIVTSMVIMYVVLLLRLEAIRNYERAQYHLEHDVITDCQNRHCLARTTDQYLNQPLVIAFGDIDHFTLLSDFYGHETTDALLGTFADAFKECFGKEHTYRYGGDDLLGIAIGEDEQQVLKHIDSCRQHLSDTRSIAIYSRVTCSFGYVTGTPQTPNELRDMIRLADIYAHQATHKGEGQTVGGAFDHAALRSGIVESNIATHARAYEINQLTGLPSMAYFIARGDELLQHIADMDRQPMVGYFNVVHLHTYNDTYGYTKGDEVIQTIANLLREALPKRHITYISGGQFGVLCYLDEIESAVHQVNDGLEAHAPGAGLQIRAGFVAYQPGDSVISLLDKAKLAHDSIGAHDTRAFCVYDAKMDEELSFRQHLVSHLDEALDKGWIQVYYQPIVHAASGEICNLEALSRWIDPTYGFLPPARFIGVLERERLIYKLSLYVVKHILQDFAYMEEHNMPVVPVSVNLSRTDFLACDMVNEIRALVDASGYSHRMLNIEITESAFAEDQGLLKAEVDRFRANGFAVWMDDFGSEYSTLNLLEELNFDLIKVDMHFMRNLTESGRNAIILSDILGMCRRLGITTLVEGVETEEQYAILRNLGSDKLQGYLFSKPCKLEELVG